MIYIELAQAYAPASPRGTQPTPRAQLVPHAPQLVTLRRSDSHPSVERLLLQSPQCCSHVAGAHAPITQTGTMWRVGSLPHLAPQAPQLSGSRVVSAHPSPQRVSPKPHAGADASAASTTIVVSARASLLGSAATSGAAASLTVSRPASAGATATHRPDSQTVPGPQAPPHGAASAASMAAASAVDGAGGSEAHATTISEKARRRCGMAECYGHDGPLVTGYLS